MPPLGERICGIFFVNGFCVLCICRLPAPLLVRREPGNGLEPHPLCEAVSILTACRGCLLPCVIECSDRTALLISVPKFADFAMINTFCFPVRPLPPASGGPCRLGSILLRPLRAFHTCVLMWTSACSGMLLFGVPFSSTHCAFHLLELSCDQSHLHEPSKGTSSPAYPWAMARSGHASSTGA